MHVLAHMFMFVGTYYVYVYISIYVRTYAIYMYVCMCVYFSVYLCEHTCARSGAIVRACMGAFLCMLAYAMHACACCVCEHVCARMGECVVV